MEIGKLVNRAYKLVRNSRVLWRLGLLAIFTEGFLNIFNWNIDPSPVAPPSTVVPVAQSQEAATLPTEQQVLNELMRWVEANQAWAFLLAALVLSLFVAVWYFSFRARVGLILNARDSEEGKPAQTYRDLMGVGRHLVWKLFGLYLTLSIIGFALIGLISSAVASSQGSTQALVGFVSLVAFLFSIFLMFYISFLFRIGEREIVLSSMRVLPAIKSAHHLLKNQIKNSFIAMIAALGLDIVYILAVAAVATVSVGVGALLAVFFSTFLTAIGVKIVVVILGAGLLFLILFMTGWYSAFGNTYWTFVYSKLKSLQDSSVRRP